MTRDEAAKVIRDKIWGGVSSNAVPEKWVDAFIELGLLKVEAPPTPWNVVAREMHAAGFCGPELTGGAVSTLNQILEKQGFEIVKKK